MKTIMLSVLALLLTVQLQAKETKVKSQIKEVTIFQSGAQINRSGSIYLKEGRSELVFSQLAYPINPQSLQVSGKGEFTILAVYHRLNYLEKRKVEKSIQQKTDSIELLKKQIEYLQKDINVYNEEATMIRANRSIGSQQNGLKAADLEAAADFFRKRLYEIYTKNLDIKYKKQELVELKTLLNNQIRGLRSTRREAVSEVVVEVLADKAGTAKLDVSYVTNNARWTAEYDLRATDITKPIELHYRAHIWQNTGVDWNNVKLTLTTGNPNQSGTIPDLYTWYLNYRRVTQKKNSLQTVAATTTSAGAYQDDVTMDVAEAEVSSVSYKRRAPRNAYNTSNYTQVVNTQTRVKYEIAIPYNIPSSKKTTQVRIQKYQLEASYRYYCVPKLDLDVFLQARITGWDALNIVPGNVNIFFDGTYVSKAHLNPNSFSDTLDLSLGRDKSIMVKRELMRDKSNNGFMGGKRRAKKNYKITIRNTKSTDINLVVEDHIPISRHKDVEVELIDKSGAKYNALTGNLLWELKMKARSTETKDYTFQVKYPKDYVITNLN
jgi:uncharacterized protein (TIGR02231 family)